MFNFTFTDYVQLIGAIVVAIGGPAVIIIGLAKWFGDYLSERLLSSVKSKHEKGFEIEPFKIIEICNAKSAYTVLQADINIGLCLPCKINVYQKDGQTFISGMRPILATYRQKLMK